MVALAVEKLDKLLRVGVPVMDQRRPQLLKRKRVEQRGYAVANAVEINLSRGCAWPSVFTRF